MIARWGACWRSLGSHALGVGSTVGAWAGRINVLFDGVPLGGDTHVGTEVGDICGVIGGARHTDGAGSDDIDDGVVSRDGFDDHARMFCGTDELEDGGIAADVDELAIEIARGLAEVGRCVGMQRDFDEHDFSGEDAVVEDLSSCGDDIDELIELCGDVMDAGFWAGGDEVTSREVGIFCGRDGDAVDIPSTSAEDERDAVENAGSVMEVECERKGF